jgi:mannose-6-phosphate isomerase-like protein (cupin superfamily)
MANRPEASGFVDNIENVTNENNLFRDILYTSDYMQLVVMSLDPGEEIGEETHKDTDQFFRIESGSGEVVINDVATPIEAGFGIVVPCGAKHNIVNNSEEILKLYTLYGPPHHKDQIIQATKADAEASSEKFDGETTE